MSRIRVSDSISKIYCFLFFAVFIFDNSVQAQFTVEGTVFDGSSNEILAGATIKSSNPYTKALSDSEGKFLITVPKKDTLYISYPEYEEQKIFVTEDTVLTVYIFPEQIYIEFDNTLLITGRAIHLKLPAPLMQIFTEHLQRDPDISITPALNRVSGVFMHSGALNTNRITIRGIGNRSPFSTTKIRAYLDNIPLTSGDGETTIEDIDMGLIQQVDVWKGPTASIYGAGLGGMIHLKTETNTPNISEIRSSLTLGSYGLLRNVSEVSYSDPNQKFQLGFKFNTTQSDGYRENNSYLRKGGSIIAKLDSDKYGKTTFIGNIIALKAFIPSSLNEEDYLQNPQKAAFTWGSIMGFEENDKYLFGLSHAVDLHNFDEHILMNKTSLFTSGRDSYESRPFNILDEKSTTIGLRSSFELTSKNAKTAKFPLLSLGVEIFKENYDWQTFQTLEGIQGELLSDNKEVRRYMNLFLQSYLSINENLTLFSGINFNSTNYQYDDLLKSGGIDKSGEYTFEGILSPHIGINYQFNYNLALFATVSHGFSPPSLAETLAPDGTINPAIAPETGWNFELGSRGRINSRFTYELTAYTMHINDLLVAERISEDQFVGLNAGKTEHNGIELFLEYQALNSTNLSLTPFLTYTYSDYVFKEFLDDGNDFSGNELTGTPPHQLDAGLDMSFKFGMYTHLNYRFIDAFPMRDDNSIYSDAYEVVNLKIGYKRTISRFEIDFSFGVQNVLDEQYASMILINAGSFGGNAPRYYYPGLPRNYFTSLSISYNFQ
ncbi:MAG: TonB-dependent receptor [Bacteroidota bacterium]